MIIKIHNNDDVWRQQTPA